MEVKKIVLIFLSLNSFVLLCQQDTIIGSIFDEPHFDGTVSRKVFSNEENVFIWKYSTLNNQNQIDLYRLNNNLEVQDSIQLTMNNKNIVEIFGAFVRNGNLISIVQIQNNSNYSLATVSTSLEFDEITIIDEVALSEEVIRLNINDFSYDELSSTYFNFCLFEETSGYSNYFIELNSDGTFHELNNINLDGNRFIISNSKIDSNYLLSTFDNTSLYLLDSNLDIIDKIENYITYQEDNQTFNTPIIVQKCFYNQDSLSCFGRTFSKGKYGISLLNYTISSANTFDLNYVKPILNIPLKIENIVGLEKDGYYYLAGTSENNPFNSQVDSNSIYLCKIEKEYPFISDWYLNFTNGDEFLAHSIDIDFNNNLYITGTTFSNFSSFDWKNFHLKIFEDGKLLNSSDIDFEINCTIYPNPVTDRITINTVKNLNDLSVHIYELSGKFLKEERCDKNSQYSVSHLNPGFYFFKVFDYSTGKNIGVKKILKI